MRTAKYYKRKTRAGNKRRHAILQRRAKCQREGIGKCSFARSKYPSNWEIKIT